MSSVQAKMEYYQAFYGDSFVEHRIRSVEPDFGKMVNAFKTDLIKKFPKLEGDTQLLKKCLLSGLRAMHALGVKFPSAYFKHSQFSDAAMVAAGSDYGNRQSQEKTRAYVDEMRTISEQRLKELDAINNRDAEIYAEYESWFQKLLADEGLDVLETKVNAYLNLIDAYPHPEGKDYYVLGWKLPIELGIYNNERVIKAMQGHPSFKDMGRKSGGTKMEINDRSITDARPF